MEKIADARESDRIHNFLQKFIKGEKKYWLNFSISKGYTAAGVEIDLQLLPSSYLGVCQDSRCGIWYRLFIKIEIAMLVTAVHVNCCLSVDLLLSKFCLTRKCDI